MPKTSVSRAVAGLIFPIDCLGCGRESDWLCPDCARQLSVSRPEQCALCGRAGFDGICDRCRTATKLDGVVALFDYHQPPIEQLIKRVKYLGQFDGLSFFADRYRRLLLRRLPAEELVATFVPATADRLAERGFNQAELLATNACAGYFPVRPLLTKTKPTAPQASLDRKSRQQNLRGLFRPIGTPTPEAVAVFDDVVTTGATLSACAKALKKSGARTVWAVTVAHD